MFKLIKSSYVFQADNYCDANPIIKRNCNYTVLFGTKVLRGIDAFNSLMKTVSEHNGFTRANGKSFLGLVFDALNDYLTEWKRPYCPYVILDKTRSERFNNFRVRSCIFPNEGGPLYFSIKN